ncbi:MAG: hypothetical protein GYA69_05495 [Candidatus Moranbacteria bacterium]|nr:hypothetical protein [Candidatus Moranbacteria bacterium]
MNKKKCVELFLFCIGMILILINIFGLFIPLKNPDIYREKKTGFENDTTISYKQALKMLQNTKNTDTKKYVVEINDIFNRAIAHYWENEGIKKYNLTIPIYENYILFLLHYIHPSSYEKYEYCDYSKTIERGVGLCSQHAIALVDFLMSNGIEAHTVGLDGHVVATADVNGEWWILDPDYGVVIPHNIEAIQRDPAIVKEYYFKKTQKNGEDAVNNIANIYERKGNVIYPSNMLGNMTYGYADCYLKKVLIEGISYILKWLIPLSLTFPLIYSSILRRRYENE